MSVSAQSTANRDSAGPTLACRRAGQFDADRLSSVQAAFESATPCCLGQSWRQAPSPAFAPAGVRVAWRDAEVLICAELEDADIQTRATAPNQRLWELGDSFEMFLGVEGQEAYVELQVSPNNQRLQLRYENQAALQHARAHGDIGAVVIPGEAFRSRVWVQPDRNRWHVLAVIPASLVAGAGSALQGACWRYSFSRYDYSAGVDEPVISSSSRHAAPDFHRKDEWGRMCFQS